MQFVDVARNGPITVVTLNRPEFRNAINIEMHFELHEAFDAFAADPEQLICVVTGAGEQAFCAGSDLKSAAAAETAIPDYPASGYAGLTARFDCAKPFIAAVNGLALGGGFELALACDIVIASDRASFGLPEPLVGAIALAGGLHRLARQIPEKLAMGMVLTSRRLKAMDALPFGFINEVVPHAGLMTTVQAWSDDILKASPLAIQASKAVMRRGLAEPDISAALRAQADYPEFAQWRQSSDLSEGLAAFAERRPPRWSGA